MNEMSFFDEPEIQEPEFEEPEPHRLPWRGTSDDTTGVVLPIVRILARNEDVAILVSGLVAYPGGFDLTVITVARLAWAKRGIPPNPMGYQTPDRPASSPEILRFGLRFADGSKAINMGLRTGRRSVRRGSVGPSSARQPRRRPKVHHALLVRAAPPARIARSRLRVAEVRHRGNGGGDQR